MGIGVVVMPMMMMGIMMTIAMCGTGIATMMMMGMAMIVVMSMGVLMIMSTVVARNVMMIVGLQMLVGAAALGLIAPFIETWDATITPRLAVAFFYTVLVPGLLATWVWFELVRRIGAVRAATFHFLSPFFGVTIGAVLLGESLGISDVIGVAIIMAGILAVQLSRQPPPVRRPPPAA